MGKKEVEFRIERYAQYDEIARLLEQVRGGAPARTEENPVPAGAPFNAAEDVREQYTRNLVIRDLSDPSVLSRDGRPPVPKVFKSPDGHVREQHSRVSLSLRGGAARKAEQASLPSWLCYGVAGTRAAGSAELHEARRAELLHQATRGELCAPVAAAERAETEATQEPSLETLVAQYAPDLKVEAGRGSDVQVEEWPPDRQLTKIGSAAKKKT